MLPSRSADPRPGSPLTCKLAIVAAARGRKILVANGAEGELANHKDELLL